MPVNLLKDRSSHRATSVRPRESSKAMAVVRKVYDIVETFLWAGLVAFIGYFLIYVLPHMSEISSRAETVRIAKISSDNSFYCEKWGMKPGTHEHTLCTMDLQELRHRVQQEMIDDLSIP
jgi:hypothetical protein